MFNFFRVRTGHNSFLGYYARNQAARCDVKGRIEDRNILGSGAYAGDLSDFIRISFFNRNVIVGADRIAKNGDTANKIGTYGLAILANAFQIPFFVAAPLSTFDLQIENGDQIPIEER